VSEASLAGARGELARPGVDVAPRAMWPTGLPGVGVPLSGKIGAAERAEPGRAIGRLTELGWGTRLRALLAEDAPDVAVPEEVLRAAVAVLAAWGWEQRPAGVVRMASRRRPDLVGSVAERLAAIGRLPVLGCLDRRGGEGASRVNSAHRVRALHDAITVGPDLVRGLENLGGAPVLLVDDYADTGWTVALAARALRRAGSGPVLPFVLAVAGAR
jgi:ATP-dependent DNA helicase RecQ